MLLMAASCWPVNAGFLCLYLALFFVFLLQTIILLTYSAKLFLNCRLKWRTLSVYYGSFFLYIKITSNVFAIININVVFTDGFENSYK